MERRQYPRIKVDCPVNVVVNSTQNPSVVFSGKTADISEGGLCFELEEPLPMDEIRSVFSKIDIYPYQIEAYVELIWNQKLWEQQKFRYGGRFTNITEEQKTHLKNIIGLNEKFVSEKLDPIMKMIDERAEYMKQRVSSFFIKEDLSCIKEFIDLELKGIKEDSQEKLNQKLDYLVDQGNEIESIINSKPIAKEIKQQFRQMLGSWLYQSGIMKHALDKPRGYPGDYRLLEIIYDNKEISVGNARFFDRYFLNNPYAVAVRNRKNLMRKILKDFISQRKEVKQLEFLNLASGSCREIKDIIEEKIDYKGKIIFTCIDFDDEALSFSEKIFKNTPKNIKITMIKENIIDLGNKPDKYTPMFKNKDLIYSIGLADYLPDKILRKLIQFCYSILNPEGKIVIAFKDRDRNRHAPLPPDWYCDWTFIPRNKAKAMELIEECRLNTGQPEILWEESGVIFFVTINKA